MLRQNIVRDGLILERNCSSGRARSGFRFCKHHRECFADKADFLACKDRACASFHRIAIARINRPSAPQLSDLICSNIFSGQHRNYARHFERIGRINPRNFGMWNRCACEGCEALPWQLNVRTIAAMPCEEAFVFNPLDRCANPGVRRGRTGRWLDRFGGILHSTDDILIACTATQIAF